MFALSGAAEFRFSDSGAVVFACCVDAWADTVLQVRVLREHVERGWAMKTSKTVAGFVALGGIAFAIVCGQMASAASHHVGAPSEDLLYDCIGWSFTIGALGGLAMFFFGAKMFAQSNR